MGKEILLYSYMYDFMIANIITEINAAGGQEITLRVNTPGGDVLDSFGLVAKLKEQKIEPSIMVDGKANSMGAFLCCYFSKVKALDVSEFTFHRAAYSNWVENNPIYFTDEVKAALVKTNTDLRAAMEGKIKASEWKKITGVSLDDLFSMESRIDVTINAEQAKKLGLIDEIITITPERRASIDKGVFAIAAMTAGIQKEGAAQSTIEISKTNTIMTLAEFKAANPAGYAEAKAEGHKEGVSAERDRVGSYMAFVEIDPKAVKEGIAGGETLSLTAMSELSLKAMAKTSLATAAADNAPAVATTEAPKDDPKANANSSAFMAEVKARIGLK